MFKTVIKFLNSYCLSPEPLLLALSGGADSLSLFYCLLEGQRQGLVTFHVAHIDHGWRAESAGEARALKLLVEGYQIPYYERTLDPSALTGNLEAACRDARQSFFGELSQQHGFQGVMLAHQQDDQLETVLKRVLEGSHWSHFIGLQRETWLQGVRYLRPLLSVSKKEIYTFLEEYQLTPFEDATNRNERFLRARMRQTILPQLNQTFGKRVDSALLYLSDEMQELREYFYKKLSPYLDRLLRGTFGSYFNLEGVSVLPFVEIKYLLRLICEKEGISLSRFILKRASEALLKNESNILLEMGGRSLVIDRQRLFLLSEEQNWSDTLQLSLQEEFIAMNGMWKIRVKKHSFYPSQTFSSWEDGWLGQMRVYLPLGDYQLAAPLLKASRTLHSTSIDRWWTKHKIPAFLRSYFPVIWKGSTIFHEFLTGRADFALKAGEECLEVIVSRESRDEKVERIAGRNHEFK